MDTTFRVCHKATLNIFVQASLKRTRAALHLRSSILRIACGFRISPFLGFDLSFGSAYGCIRISTGTSVRFFARCQCEQANYRQCQLFHSIHSFKGDELKPALKYYASKLSCRLLPVLFLQGSFYSFVGYQPEDGGKDDDNSRNKWIVHSRQRQ